MGAGSRFSNDFVKGEFGHDLIRDDINYRIICAACGKIFNFLEVNDENKNILREPCPKKINKQLKINKEKEMIEMLGKYFCIWKV